MVCGESFSNPGGGTSGVDWTSGGAAAEGVVELLGTVLLMMTDCGGACMGTTFAVFLRGFSEMCCPVVGSKIMTLMGSSGF